MADARIEDDRLLLAAFASGGGTQNLFQRDELAVQLGLNESQVAKVIERLLRTRMIMTHDVGQKVISLTEDGLLRAARLADAMGVNTGIDQNESPPDPQGPGRAKATVASPSEPRTWRVATQALSDRPAAEEEDALDFQDYAAAIVEFLKDPHTFPPLALGVSGNWGAGKTTLLEWLEKRLPLGRKPFVPIWISAWSYDRREVVWAGLASEVLKQLTWAEHLQLWWARAAESSWGSALVLSAMLGSAAASIAIYVAPNWTILIGIVVALYPLAVKAYTTLGGPFRFALLTLQGPDYSDRLGFQHQFQQDLRRCVRILRKKGDVVMFIDDLDRAPPSVITELLEAMNLVLGEENCFFVIGFDSRIVSAALESKYSDLMKRLTGQDVAFSGMEFIEKLVQVTFNIPPPSRLQIDRLVDSLITSRPSGDPKPRIARSAERRIRLGREARSEMPSSSGFVESEEFRDAVKLVSEFLPANPRKVKRFINTFRLLCHIANKRRLFEQGMDPYTLALLTLVALEFPDVYGSIQASRSVDVCDRIARVVQGTSNVEILPEGIRRDPDRYRRALEAFTTLRLTEDLDVFLSLTGLVAEESP